MTRTWDIAVMRIVKRDVEHGTSTKFVTSAYRENIALSKAHHSRL